MNLHDMSNHTANPQIPEGYSEQSGLLDSPQKAQIHNVRFSLETPHSSNTNNSSEQLNVRENDFVYFDGPGVDGSQKVEGKNLQDGESIGGPARCRKRRQKNLWKTSAINLFWILIW